MLRLAFASLLAAACGASLAQSAPYPDGPRIPSLPESAFERIDRALRDRVATAVDADALFVRGLQATMDPGARIADYAGAWRLRPADMLLLSSLADACMLRAVPTWADCAALDPASRAGTELLLSNDPSDPTSAERLQDIEDLLAETGHTLEDVSLAFAYAPTDDGFGASITAFRVRGSDAAALLQGLLPLITIDYTDVQQDTVTVAGQEYVRVSDGPYDPQGIYEVLIPRGDTVWAISAADKVLAEIAAALPG